MVGKIDYLWYILLYYRALLTDVSMDTRVSVTLVCLFSMVVAYSIGGHDACSRAILSEVST